MVRDDHLDGENVNSPSKSHQGEPGGAERRRRGGGQTRGGMKPPAGRPKQANSESEAASEEALQRKDHSHHTPERTYELKLNVSKNLFRKVQQQAMDEGIAISDLLVEYITESVTLRAWEILERKAQMKQGPQTNNHNRGQPMSKKRPGGRGMSPGQYQSIMDDKANFLEYVRTQERNRR